MAHIYDRVVKLISKTPEERDDREVDLLIPWFQNMSGLFKAQKIDVVKDIVRNCDFRSIPADSVIIKQGDKGDCFYIILSGSVSVYINQTLEEHDNVAEPSQSSHARRRKARLSRPSTGSRTPGGQQTPTSTSSETKSGKPELEDKAECSDGHEKKTEASTDENNLDDRKNVVTTHDKTLERTVSGSIADSGLSSCGDALLDENDSEFGQDQLDAARESDKSDVEDSDAGDSDFDFSSSSSEDSVLEEPTTSAPFERKAFGVHIRELGAGKCFGELALVQTNLVRTASIITEQQTNLLVIDRELYNRSLKAAQQHEFNLKTTFVTTFPLFRNWTPRQRNVMAMSLTRYQYHFDNTIVRQGAPVTGIHFITQGSAVVTTDTVQHIGQYPRLCTDKDVQFAKDVKTGRGLRITHPGTGTDDADGVPTNLKAGHHWIRRKETYAQAEKARNYKNTDVCVIGAGDYIGDMEALLRLPTYSFTVKCLQGVDSFELNLNNFERQVAKRNPTAYSLMRETALTKMQARVDRLQRDEQQLYMPVLERMLDKLNGTAKSWKKQARSRASFSMAGMDHGDVSTKDPTTPLRDYRENQRRFLRHRQREKDMQEQLNMRLAHAVSLGRQLERQNNHDEQTRKSHVTKKRLTPIESELGRRISDFLSVGPSNGRARSDSAPSGQPGVHMATHATKEPMDNNRLLIPDPTNAGIGQLVAPLSPRAPHSPRVPRVSLAPLSPRLPRSPASRSPRFPRSRRDLSSDGASSTSSLDAIQQDYKLLASRMNNAELTKLRRATSTLSATSVSLTDLGGRSRPTSSTFPRPRLVNSQTLPETSRPDSSTVRRFRSFSIT